MTEFQIYLLSIIEGFVGCLTIGLILGLLLPPSDRLMDRVASAVKVTTCAIMALAVAMVLSILALGDAFAILPYWPTGGVMALYVVTVGALRGVSLRKYGLWI
jgi:hypothetical protein